ncbi:MAG: Diguanylate cyclase/phosphodiesterase [Synergistales bacterium 53_16]|nr:MAG: Diguanylate cyclase/phosphodiesterase [Synergistales bacterium 53_16]
MTTTVSSEVKYIMDIIEEILTCDDNSLADERLLQEIIEKDAIRTVFHPIVDLYSASVIGYEVLSRGVPPMESPVKMFQVANEANLLWPLEYACRKKAITKISSLPQDKRSLLYFINVAPNILSDPRFKKGFTLENIQQYELDQRNLVIEITERNVINDHDHLESLIRHYSSQGFKISLDDFGSGYSGLETLVTASPHYIKLDMSIVRDIHLSPYKQVLVKALNAFAENVNARFIAEGVEEWEELETLLMLGVRYAQGFLFSRPKEEPVEISDEIREMIFSIVTPHTYRDHELDETIELLTEPGTSIELGRATCEDIFNLFKKDAALHFIIMVDSEKPIALITKQDFYMKAGGPFGYSLFQSRPAEYIAKKTPLIVRKDIPVVKLAKLAMERPYDDLYDPVIAVDDNGKYAGIVTMKQLLLRSVRLQIQSAQDANPLTGLPGNRAIEKWILKAMEDEEFSVVYCDLDKFKEYNDVYGFMAGDDLIRLTAKILVEGAGMIPGEARVGHIGGDDFVIVSPSIVSCDVLRSICQSFDGEKLSLFKPEDIDRGFYEAISRKGERIQVPLVTLSMAVIDSRNTESVRQPAFLSHIASSLKKEAKLQSARERRSTFLYERRHYDSRSVKM